VALRIIPTFPAGVKRGDAPLYQVLPMGASSGRSSAFSSVTPPAPSHRRGACLHLVPCRHPAPQGEGRIDPKAEGALPAQFVIAYVVVTAVAVFLANYLARSKRRAATGWMWAAALFPPAVVLLALLPGRAVRSGAAA
jgi:hypothetical protein